MEYCGEGIINVDLRYIQNQKPMAEENTRPAQEQQKNDEIDLLELFRRMGRGIGRMFRWMGTAFVTTTVFMIRKSPIWILGILIGGGVAYTQFKLSERYYESNMILKANAVPNQDMISYINELHNYAREGNKTQLEAKLGLDSAEVKDLVDIEAFWIVDLNNDGIFDQVDYKNRFLTDTNVTKVEERFNIRALTRTPEELSRIQEGLTNYIGGYDYYQRRNEIRLRQLKQLIAKTEDEIGELDSLQKKKYFEQPDYMRLKEGQLLFMGEEQTELFHTDVFQLFNDKQRYEEMLEIDSMIYTVIQDFATPQQPTNDIRSYAKLWIPIMFVVSILLAIILHFWKDMRKVYERY